MPLPVPSISHPTHWPGATTSTGAALPASRAPASPQQPPATYTHASPHVPHYMLGMPGPAGPPHASTSGLSALPSFFAQPFSHAAPPAGCSASRGSCARCAAPLGCIASHTTSCGSPARRTTSCSPFAACTASNLSGRGFAWLAAALFLWMVYNSGGGPSVADGLVGPQV